MRILSMDGSILNLPIPLVCATFRLIGAISHDKYKAKGYNVIYTDVAMSMVHFFGMREKHGQNRDETRNMQPVWGISCGNVRSH